MHTLKTFITLGLIFLFVALCSGVYVWYQLQDLSREVAEEQRISDKEPEDATEQPPDSE